MIDPGILKLVEEIPLADTHEHLIEEQSRLVPGDRWRLNDIGVLFSHYADNDLVSAGMSQSDMDKALRLETPPDEKWQLISPWWSFIKNSGYGSCVTESIRKLFDESDLTEDNWQSINKRIGEAIKPGYYHPILREKANLCDVQVNSLEQIPFCQTEYPDLLRQDISFFHLSSVPAVKELELLTGIEISSLDRFLQVIDWVFDTYANRAVAIKNQGAYIRRLDYTIEDKDAASRSFDRFLSGQDELNAEDTKPFEDYLFQVCVEKAIEYNLPVKLHTGYYAGTGYMPMHRLAANPGDVTDLLMKFPKAEFVLMHTMYPMQDEAIAIAKHFPNAIIDMCWSWIVSPEASVRFLKEIITAAPINKVLTFGGDFAPAELIPGHATIARRGIARALSDLNDVQWFGSDRLERVAKEIMWGNASRRFGQ